MSTQTISIDQLITVKNLFATKFRDSDQSHEFDVYGTLEKPLFVANQVANILGIKNIHQNKFEFEDICEVYVFDSNNTPNVRKPHNPN